MNSSADAQPYLEESEIVDDLKARLRATEFDKGSIRAPYQRLNNPDGPEAAGRIEKLEAENARLGEALRSVGVATDVDATLSDNGGQ